MIEILAIIGKALTDISNMMGAGDTATLPPVPAKVDIPSPVPEEIAAAPPLVTDPPPAPGVVATVLDAAANLPAPAPDPGLIKAPPANLPDSPAALGQIELDSEGLPWDERIHVKSRTKIKDGTWRIKPKTGALVIAQVKTELKQGQPAPTPTPAPVPEAPGVMTFIELMSKIAVSPSCTPETIQAAITAAGLTTIEELSTRADMVPTVANNLGLL